MAVALSFTGGANAQETAKAFVQRKGAAGNAGIGAIYVVSGDDKTIKYKATRVDLNDNSISLNDLNLFFEEPLEYRAALDLFLNRKYKEALKAFKAVQKTYESVKDVPFNYSAMSALRALECEFKLMNAAEMAKADTAWLKKVLPMEGAKNQVAVFDLWKHVEKKDWASLEKEAKSLLEKKKLPRAIVAQGSYLLGLAYANQGKAEDALNSFSEAMLIDSTNSIEITRESILRSMEIYSKDEGVVQFLQANASIPKGVAVPRKVKEGAALMHMWKNNLFISPTLPKEYEKFLGFYVAPPKKEAPKQEQAATPTPAK